MTRILVIAEHAHGKLNISTRKTVSCAVQIAGAEIDVVVFSNDAQAVATQAAQLANVRSVLKVEHPVFAHPLAATYAPAIVELASNYSHIFAPSTTFGKDLMPRVAALLGVGQISDVMAVESSHRFVRPIYAGNAIVTLDADPQYKLVATIRTASFQPVATTGHANIESISVSAPPPNHTRFISHSQERNDRPDLQSAARVVAGGRALGSAENFNLIYQLADQLGAGVGASRAAVDAGYAANELQVGQTGKIIAPDLYIAVGISGAIQHLTGIKDARTIVAINKDPEAPIFEVADVGLVGDLFTVLPELSQHL